jgi:hypothetical protein
MEINNLKFVIENIEVNKNTLNKRPLTIRDFSLGNNFWKPVKNTSDTNCLPPFLSVGWKQFERTEEPFDVGSL